LARAISKMGFTSRSQAAELIRQGRVKLNGGVRRDPETPVVLGKDRIEIDHSPLSPSKRIYWMLNKPRGVVTTAADQEDRQTVYAYLPENLGWFAPVGRLDKASEGLLLLTNDSEWANRVTDPATHLDKIYQVQIGAIADLKLLEKLAMGVRSEEGEQLRVKRAVMLRHGEHNSWLEIVLDEGKNRQIRRIFAGLGIEVLRLLRVAIGPLPLGNLGKGESRPLTAEEKSSLDVAMKKARTGMA
jgi:23S rRNA pseudouridine2605 synthase